MRLTKKVRQQLLEQNEGFVTETHFKGSHFTEHRRYEISDGELYIHATGKGGAFGAMGGSQFNKEDVADDDQTRRFLKNNLGVLNTDGVE